MKKTIRVTDIKISADGVSFVVLVMSGDILISKSPEYYVKFDRPVRLRNSTVKDVFRSVFRSWGNREAIKNYDVVIELKDDFDVAEARKGYVNYMLIDSLGLDSNAVNMVLDGTIQYTTLNIQNYKPQAQQGLSVQHSPAVKAQIKLPQAIDNGAIRFNIDHNFNFQVTGLFLADDLGARMMFNGSVDEWKSNMYRLGTGFNICTSTFINGSVASMIMNLALDRDNFWNRFLDCGGTLPHFKDFKKLMMALYADQYLNLGYMTDERVAEYIGHRQIKLTDHETVSANYEKELAGQTTRQPGDVIYPLLNVGKDKLYGFFEDGAERAELDKIYAMLGDEKYAKNVEACRAPFRLFNRDILVKDLSDDKASLDAISGKLDSLEARIKDVADGQR
jgi:hypothetical protein